MAIGSGSEGANTALQEEHRGDLTFAEAEVLVLKTLKQVMEEKVRFLSAGRLFVCRSMAASMLPIAQASRLCGGETMPLSCKGRCLRSCSRCWLS